MRFEAGTVLSLAVKSLLNRRATAALTIFAIAISVTLFLGVDQLRKSARASFESTLSGTDLLVGARSGDINLLLYAVFRLGDPTANVDWRTYREIARRDDVAWTIPISLGDSYYGYRVVGTNQDYFTHYRYGTKQALVIKEGRKFSDLFDAVLGAEVAAKRKLKVGDEIVLSHGIAATSFSKHDDKPFRVSGILAATGTPVDRAVHISLAGLEAIHLGWQGGVKGPMARRYSKENVRGMALEPKSITAFLVGMKSRVMTLRLQREINTYDKEALSAVLPGAALARLWQVVGVAETALTVIAGFVVVTGLIGMLIALMTSLNERRREMALLRAVGARPHHIFALLVLEAFVLALAGTVVGTGLVAGGMAIAAPIVQAKFGIVMASLVPGARELMIVGIVLGAALLLGMIPGFMAYRRSLADGLQATQ